MTTYYGGSGNDTVNAGTGNDVVYGYGGNDTVYANGGDDIAYGGDGAESAFGGSGADTLYGDAGNDTLSGDAGYDSLFGGTGDDLLKGANDIYDDFFGGDGNDTILAGDYDEDWAWGDAGNDLIQTGGGSDIAWGGTGADTLYGGGGNDQLHGNAGADSLLGEVGLDTLSGGAGDDTLDGGADNDLLLGGSGRDSLLGGAGDDLIRGDSDSFDGFDASYGPTNTTLTVTNSGPFAVDLYWIDTTATPVFVATLAPGGSWSGSTGTTHNWYLAETASGNVVEVIYGAANQTVTFSPPFDDTIFGGDGNDTIFGDYGNDSVSGDAGHDSLNTGTGNDSVFGGSGNDQASLGAGDDSFGTWASESGDDSIDAGAGNDTVIAGEGNDTVSGGDGNDWLSGASGFDTLYGGAGSDQFAITDDHQGDTIYGGESPGDQDLLAFANYTSTQGVIVTFSADEAGAYDYAGTDGAGSFSAIEAITGTAYGDSITAALTTSGTTIASGAGADSLTGGAGADTLYFGTGDDTVYGGAGHDLIDDTANTQEAGANLIDAGAGDDTVWAGHDADTLFGGAGQDALFGEGGHDLLLAGAGNDLAQGGDGNDTLSGGSGLDTLTGGSGADRFQLVEADSGDRITDFDLTFDNSLTIDRLDVSDLRNPDGSNIRTWDVTINDDGSGNTLLGFPQGESVVLQGVSPAQVSAPGMLAAMGVPCFAAGTQIATPTGPRAVESLMLGDRVCLAKGGSAPILWHGQRSLTAADLARHPALRPIRIKAGHHGAQRDLLVSPQHCLAITGPDGRAALIRAGHLADLRWGARAAHGLRFVTYHHLLLPRHALLLAEGAEAESLYPGPQALLGFTAVQRARLLAVMTALCPPVPGLSVLSAYGGRCLPILSRRSAMTLGQGGVPPAGIVSANNAPRLPCAAAPRRRLS